MSLREDPQDRHAVRDLVKAKLDDAIADVILEARLHYPGIDIQRVLSAYFLVKAVRYCRFDLVSKEEFLTETAKACDQFIMARMPAQGEVQ